MAVDYPGNILTSSDGITWNSMASGTSNSLYAITFGKGLFVTVGLKEPSLHLQMGSHGLKEILGQQRLFIKLHMVEINL